MIFKATFKNDFKLTIYYCFGLGGVKLQWRAVGFGFMLIVSGQVLLDSLFSYIREIRCFRLLERFVVFVY